jgi:hypothetical protein
VGLGTRSREIGTRSPCDGSRQPVRLVRAARGMGPLSACEWVRSARANGSAQRVRMGPRSPWDGSAQRVRMGPLSACEWVRAALRFDTRSQPCHADARSTQARELRSRSRCGRARRVGCAGDHLVPESLDRPARRAGARSTPSGPSGRCDHSRRPGWYRAA